MDSLSNFQNIFGAVNNLLYPIIGLIVGLIFLRVRDIFLALGATPESLRKKGVSTIINLFVVLGILKLLTASFKLLFALLRVMN